MHNKFKCSVAMRAGLHLPSPSLAVIGQSSCAHGPDRLLTRIHPTTLQHPSLFNPEDGGSMVTQNIGTQPKDYMAQ